MRWLGNALASSIGRKVVMALTGLLLIGFLAEHLYGNLKLIPPFGEPGGGDFVEYRDGLHSFGIWLTLAEIGLFALFAAHAYLGIRLSLENREARRSRYVVRNDHGAQTFGSASMFVTGALVLGYLIKHVLDFRFDGDYQEAPAVVVAETLSHPGHAVVYLAALAVLGLHLSHGFQSAFQTFGLGHPRWRALLRGASYALAFALAAGFALIPLYFLFLWNGGAS